MAVQAAQMGADLIISARREEKLLELAASLPQDCKVEVLPFDLMEPEQFHSIVERALPVDYLINSGGISQRSPAMATRPEVTRQLMETNFFATVELSRLTAQAMQRRRSGHIVAISSVVGYIGTPMRAGYAASKHALHGYFDSLRYELHQDDVKVSIICPGYIHTDISLNAVTADGKAQGSMDEGQANGMSAETFAKKAWKGLIAGRPEIFIGGSEIYGIYLKRFFPKLLDSIMLKRKWDGQQS